jgi:hypothetical protein
MKAVHILLGSAVLAGAAEVASAEKLSSLKAEIEPAYRGSNYARRLR